MRPSKSIRELFTFPAEAVDPAAVRARSSFFCDIIGLMCVKNNDERSEAGDPQLAGPLGVCSVMAARRSSGASNASTIVCPVRLYEQRYQALRSLASEMLGVPTNEISTFSEWSSAGKPDPAVVLVGKAEGREIDTEAGSLDWVAARLRGGRVVEYAGIEVQAIDTTGNYRAARRALLKGLTPIPASAHGLNWENVNKRIAPQLIRKGRLLQGLRSEGAVGLGFLVDDNVFGRLQRRLASPLIAESQGDLFIHSYALGAAPVAGKLLLVGPTRLQSSIDQLVTKFTSVGTVSSVAATVASVLWP